MTKLKATIYKLTDPHAGVAFYVGKTQGTLANRLGGHLHERKDCRRTRRIQWMLSQGRTPVIEEIEVVPNKAALSREKHWIRQLKLDGLELVNGRNKHLEPACARLNYCSTGITTIQITTALKRRIKELARKRGMKTYALTERLVLLGIEADKTNGKPKTA